jgi:dihydroorotate dehydrogenase
VHFKMYDFNGLKISRRLIISSAFEYGWGYGFQINPWMWFCLKAGWIKVDYFGAFITSTITIDEIIPKNGYGVRIYPDKILNKKSWANCGIVKFEEKLKKLGSRIGKCIVSVGSLKSIEEMLLLVKRLDGYDIAGIEFNISCHNVNLNFFEDENVLRKLCRGVRRLTNKPLILKINYESDYVSLSRIAQEEGFNLIHAMNTMRFHSGSLGDCAVSSFRNKSKALKVIRELRKGRIAISIIGGSGIWTMKDIEDYQRSGADVFSMSHQLIYFPPWASVLATRLK